MAEVALLRERRKNAAAQIKQGNCLGAKASGIDNFRKGKNKLAEAHIQIKLNKCRGSTIGHPNVNMKRGDPINQRVTKLAKTGEGKSAKDVRNWGKEYNPYQIKK